MSFNKDEILSIFNSLNLQEDIKLTDIPHIHLYMDQVIQLFENNLSHSKRNKEDKLLTKTMINNYTKDKLLMPVKNKKYTREHIILMILVYHLKQGLSIGDIKVLFNNIVVASPEDKDNIANLDSFYSLFLDLKNTELTREADYLHQLLDRVQNITSEEQHSEYEKLLLTVLALINSSNIQKRMAEKIIDSYFNKI